MVEVRREEKKGRKHGKPLHDIVSDRWPTDSLMARLSLVSLSVKPIHEDARYERYKFAGKGDVTGNVLRGFARRQTSRAGSCALAALSAFCQKLSVADPSITALLHSLPCELCRTFLICPYVLP